MKRSYGYHGLDGCSDERNKRSLTRKEEADFDIYADADEDISSNNRNKEREEKLPEDASGRKMENSMAEDGHNEDMSTVYHDANAEDGDAADDFHDPMDDSQLSAFSAVPDMTSFAKLRESPMKAARNGLMSPANQRSPQQHGGLIDPTTPSTAKKTNRTGVLIDDSSPADNLLDFTDQINFPPSRQIYGAQSTRYSPMRGSPLRPTREPMKSPSKLSLLDFDIPPAPTPKSVPSVTPRELESLKSGFLSEISSLKATLSGKDAEVTSLEQSVADAERRVGEALENTRTESTRREALQLEQAEWVQRCEEMETVLRNIKSEMIENERERERLTKKMEEAEKGRERFEGKMVELTSQLSAARNSEANATGNTAGEVAGQTKTAEETANEVQDAVEKVARDLHTLYKGKHETKVAALKKSYEARWEKRVRQVEDKLKAALAENESLKAEQGAVAPQAADPNSSMIAHANDEHEANKRVLEAQIKGLQQEITAFKEDSERVRAELDMERVEKGELVAAVDEWLAMQQSQQPSQAQQQQQQQRQSQLEKQRSTEPPSSSPQRKPRESPSKVPEQSRQTDNFRRRADLGGPSGIRPPSGSTISGEKKLSKYSGTPGRAVHGRVNSGGKSGIAVLTPGRGGIMGSIERMGRGGGA